MRKHFRNNRQPDRDTSVQTQEFCTVDVTSLTTDGRGFARHPDGQVLFIDGALPQQTVVCEVIRRKKSFWEARVSEILKESPLQTKPLCQHFHYCGGCKLQHLKQEEHLPQKKNWFLETLRRLGRWEEKHLQHVATQIQCVSASPWHYRNRIRLHFNGNTLGFMESASHRIFQLVECPISSEFIENRIGAIRKLLLSRLSSATRKKFENKPIEIEVTVAGTNALKLSIEVPEHAPELRKLLQETEFSFHDDLLCFPHPTLNEYVVHRKSFIQPHRDAVSLYGQEVRTLVEKFLSGYKNKNELLEVWDLYAGSGVFTPIVPHLCQEKNIQYSIVAVEGVARAMDALKANCKHYSVQTSVSDVGEFLGSAQKAATIVILDPPRTGLELKNATRLVQLLDNVPNCLVVWVSCDAASFSRDAKVFLEKGFQLSSLSLYDCFAQTAHYETIASFTR